MDNENLIVARIAWATILLGTPLILVGTMGALFRQFVGRDPTIYFYVVLFGLFLYGVSAVAFVVYAMSLEE